MKRFQLFTVISLSLPIVMGAVGCKRGNGDGDGVYPENFNAIGDAGRVAYIMRNAEPDSVARFIYDGALGKLQGAKIDTLGVAITYVNEKYTGEKLDKYYIAAENLKARMSLADKMRVYTMEGYEDPEGVGFTLGLEYMQNIRERNLQVDDIRTEIEAFRKATRQDPQTFNRFLIGFKTVLKNDRNKDLPMAVYNAFIDYK